MTDTPQQVFHNSLLESAFKEFMNKLQDDIGLHLGEGTAFMVRLDVKIGVEPKNEKKMKAYEPKLSQLLNSMPSRVTPVETASGKEDKEDFSKLAKKEPEEME